MLRNLFRSTLLVGLLIGLAGIAAYGTITYLITHEEPVILPDLTGRDIVPVLQSLHQLGLNLKLLRMEYSTDHAKNRVIDQDPGPGTEIKKGREVRVTLSKGPLTQPMPDLIGLSLQTARSILVAEDLCQGHITRTRDADRGRDEILAQTPGTGTAISRETCVDLLVNRGNADTPFHMPLLTGGILAHVLSRMTELGLVQGRITYGHAIHHAPDTVLEQVPVKGTPITRGTRVDLMINAPENMESRPPMARPQAPRLLRHRLPQGFLQQRVRIQWETGSLAADLFDDFVRPGEEVWVLVPRFQDAQVTVFESESRVNTLKFQVQNPD